MSNQTIPSALAEEGTEDTLIPALGSANTMLAASKAAGAVTASGRTTQARTTVLPSFSEAGVVHRERDRYQVLEVLGRGGMGEVSLAKDHDIDRPVALKYLHAQLADPALLARFVEEIHTVGHLEHPNIVPIHDVGLDEQGRYFFVMKHLEGETLEQIIEKLRARDPAYEARFTFERRAELVLGILNALEFAHAKGVVHRDVKPANVMVGKHGEVVLMDWGIAKSRTTRDLPVPSPSSPAAGERLVQTQYGAVLGTPLYMAPEQAEGRSDAIDPRTDLYSVAVLMHELMTLEHYLDGRSSLTEILEGVKTVVPERTPRQYTRFPRAPAGYLHLARKGLQKDPAARFQSSGELQDRIRQVMEGVVEVQCQTTFVRRMAGEVGRFIDRRPTLATPLIIGGSVVGLAYLGVSAMAIAQWLGH